MRAALSAIGVIGAVTAADAARADPLQDRLLAAARATDADAYAFRQTLTAGGTGSARRTFVDDFDPRRAPADRWRLVSVDGRAPTAKELARSRKTKRDRTPSYAELARWIGAPATRVAAPHGYAIYRYARLPAGIVKLGSHDASADTAAEVTVDARGAQPFVETVRFTSTRGFRMMLVAAVRSFTFLNRYRQLPGGDAVLASSNGSVTGSMMGKSGAITTQIGYSEYRKVR